MLRIFVTLMVFVGTAQAWEYGEEIISSRDWTLTVKNNICFAYTEGQRDDQEYQWGFTLAKDSGRPIEWIITRTGRGAKVPGLQGGIQTASVLMQFGILASGKEEKFIFLGNRPLQFVHDQLKSVNEIKFAPDKGQTKPVQFSLRGFGATLTELEKRCNGGLSVTKNEFDTQFLQGVPEQANIALLDITKVTNIKTLLSKAYDLFLSGAAAQKELADLRAKYGSELSRAEQLDAQIIDLRTNRIPDMRGKISQSEANLAQATKDLQSVNQRIPGLEAAIVPLQSDYDAKKAVLDQVAPEHDRLAEILDDAETALDRAETSLRNTTSRLSWNRNEQSRLEGRARNLAYELQNLDRDRVNAQSELRSAQSELDRFDLRWEIQKRLQSNWRYDNAKRELRDLERQSRDANQEVNRARSVRDQAGQALRQCQSVQGADCTQQQNNLNEATRLLDQAKDNERSVNGRLNSVRNEIDNIEREAERDARYEQNRLISRRDDAQRRLDSIENQIASKRNEMDRINSVDLPNLRQEERSLEDRESSLRASLPGLRSNVASAQGNLDSYDGRVGYDAKKAAADGAKEKLDGAIQNLEDARNEKTQLEEAIETTKTNLASYRNQLSQLLNELTQAQNELKGLQPILDKYRAEKAPIDAKIANLKTQLDGTRAEFVKNLPTP